VNDVPQEENRGIQEKMKAEEPDLTFSREDLLLGDLHHNRPLYLSGYIGEVKLRQVQVDPGSAINVIPLKTVRKLGIPTRKLSSTKTQGTTLSLRKLWARFASSARLQILRHK